MKDYILASILNFDIATQKISKISDNSYSLGILNLFEKYDIESFFDVEKKVLTFSIQNYDKFLVKGQFIYKVELAKSKEFFVIFYDNLNNQVSYNLDLEVQEFLALSYDKTLKLLTQLHKSGISLAYLT